VRRGKSAAFAAAVRHMVDARPGKLSDLSVAYTRRCFEPLFTSPFRMTRSYAGSLVGGMKEMAELAKRVPEAEFFDMPPDMIFVNRLQFGFYSVLARLDVSVDYRAIERTTPNVYAQPFNVGFMEGLWVDATSIWLVADNNGFPRVSALNDRRSTLWRCPRLDLVPGPSGSKEKNEGATQKERAPGGP
jgi:hypothetical protein